MSDIYSDFLAHAGGDERSGQRRAVELLIELSDCGTAEHYAIQAPTGTGKSYAALLAGVHNARNGRRTVVGTSTVVLSEQYAKDMVVVAKAFPDVRFSLLKGASNYYCGNKVGEELSKAKTSVRKKEMIAQLAGFKAGRLSNLPAWATCDTEYCTNCAERLRKSGRSECEYARARAAALNAQVVVTTHAMIQIDTRMSANKNKGSILGSIWLTIFDEAHKASESLTYDDSFGTRAIRKLDFHGVLQPIEFSKRGRFVNHIEDLGDLGWAEEQKWVNPSIALATERLSLWPTEPEIDSMMKLVDESVTDRESLRLKGYVEFLKRARVVLRDIQDGFVADNTALWTRGGSYKMREMVPDDELVETLEDRRTAWMSATIGTEGREKYSLEKCGLSSGAKFFDLESPFDYAEQLKWTVRTDADVKDEAGMLTAVNTHWPGGMAVLTPYHKRKERIADKLKVRASPGDLIQHQAVGGGAGTANSIAVKKHCDVADAGGSPVLVGVEVFSTGIDLPGDRLKKLVIAGLFPLRDDLAYQAWRTRWLEAVGGNGFDGYELPERAIILEQQIGRVIRRPSDTGVVVFYIEDSDWKSGSAGRAIILEALKRFPGAVRI